MKVSIKKWSDGTYLSVFNDGKRTTRKCASLAEAEKLKADLELLMKARGAEGVAEQFGKKKPAAVTFGVYAARYLESVARERAGRTVALYSMVIRTYVLPYFAETPVQAITRPDLKNWALGLKSAKRGERLSKSTVGIAAMLVRHVLAEALDDELIEKNPAEGLLKKHFDAKPAEEVEPFA